MNYPSYLEAYANGRLIQLIEKSWRLLESCSLCPRKCGVNRLREKRGFCRLGARPKVYSFMAHHGEEPPISGSQGSGTIFFSSCNLACVYCQNFTFSQQDNGKEVTDEQLASMMVELQNLGCHNINLVTPTPQLPQILRALPLAIAGGLKIPLVYNTSGYELAKMVSLLDGIVDIYLADLRYGARVMGQKYSQAPDYPRYSQEALCEMHRQVGIAKIDVQGIIQRGLIIRHLVLPAGVSGTEEIMRFIAQRLSLDSYVSLMSQYQPCYQAKDYPEINRRLSEEEYIAAQAMMHKYGLYNGWTQEGRGLERFAGTNLKPNL